MHTSEHLQRRRNPFASDACAPAATAAQTEPTLERAGVEPVELGLEPEQLDRIDPRPARLLGPELRAMSGHEEQLVDEFAAGSGHGPSNTAALCNELIARCLVAPGHDPGPARERVAALTVSERDLALVALRRQNYGDVVETLIDCPVCGERNETRFDLAELPLELPPIPTRLRARVGELGEAELRLPSAGDQAELLALGLESSARRRSWLLARVLLRLDTQRPPFTPEQLHDSPVALRRGLERALAQALPDLDLSLDVRCHACGHSFVSPFEIESFFLPS